MSKSELTGEQTEAKAEVENKLETENETQSESSTEKNEQGESLSSDSEDKSDANNLPWNKDPRFKEMIEMAKAFPTLKQELESLKGSMTEVQGSLPKKSPEIPQEFKDLFGDNAEAWEKYDALSKRQKESWIKEYEERTQAKEREKQETEQRSQEWLKSELQTLTDEGKTFDKNKLIKIATEYMPTDENGLLSIPKAYELYKKFEAIESMGGSKGQQDAAKRSVADKAGVSQERGSGKPGLALEDLRQGLHSFWGKSN